MNKIMVGTINKDKYSFGGIVKIYSKGEQVYVLAKIIDRKRELYPSGIGYTVLYEDLSPGDIDSESVDVDDSEAPVFISK